MSKKLDLSKGISAEQEADLRARYSNEHVNYLLTQAKEMQSAGAKVEESPAVDAETVGDDYEAMTNEQLREELKARDLATSGGKAELVARLREDDASA